MGLYVPLSIIEVLYSPPFRTDHPWIWQYCKLMHNVMATAFAAKIPPYAKVLELDRKVRDFPVPYSMRGKCGMQETPEPSRSTHIKRYFCMAAKEISE